MNQTLRILFYLIAVSLVMSPPTYAQTTADKSQQKRISQVDLADKTSSGMNSEGKSKPKVSSHNSNHSLQSLSDFEQNVKESSTGNEPKTLAAVSKLGGSAAPLLPDFTKKSTLSVEDSLQVNAWSGTPSLNIPLIHVPGNDELSLNVYYTFDGFASAEQMKGHSRGKKPVIRFIGDFVPRCSGPLL